ncbi:hypothetical protein V6U77_25925 [Micromonospora sp. CPCC 205546]|uniref:hypothetical protein n=1 Tax=Micromonospora sp. CPCC 205546 TaxID=3122397 RepID=UPI002FEF89D1
MIMNHPGTPSPLAWALQQLHVHGAVSLPGRRSDPVIRWLKRRRLFIGISLGIMGLGVLVLIAGIALRQVGVWALGIPIGAFLVFVGVVYLGVVLMTGRLMGGRVRAETQPVVIDATGIILRGIGPIPWSDVAPPERRRIPVKNDIGGLCTVMPLTEQGHARVNSQLGWWTNLVGPKPYLRWDLPYLLLPGIDGLSEDETVHLFRIARERYAR